MNNGALQTSLILLIGLVVGGISGALLLQSSTIWLTFSIALLAALLAWWQTPCIRVALNNRFRQKTRQVKGWEKEARERKKEQRFPCLKHWIIRLSGYGLLVFATVTGTTIWQTRQATTLNVGIGGKDKIQALPASHAINTLRWELGIKSLPTLVTIPSGEFEMGSALSPDEQPIHTVTIHQGFQMSHYEITFDDYDYYVWTMQKHTQQYTKENKLKSVNYPYDEGWGRGSLPVINVSWQDVQGYVNWLSKQTKTECRLPSEAEWEYAARAETTTAYPWGNEASHEKANYGKDECCGGLEKGRDKWINTAPVGSFPANDFGLHDMHGNVWEWVQDCYEDNYNKSPSDGSASEKDNCGVRVLRGGSWSFDPDLLRSADRYFVVPDFRDYTIGFRVVCALPSTDH